MQNDKLKSVLTDLQKERCKIAEKSEPLKVKRSVIQAQISPLEAESRELTIKIREMEGDQLVTLDKQIGVLARALGAKSISADPQQANKIKEA